MAIFKNRKNKNHEAGSLKEAPENSQQDVSLTQDVQEVEANVGEPEPSREGVF